MSIFFLLISGDIFESSESLILYKQNKFVVRIALTRVRAQNMPGEEHGLICVYLQVVSRKIAGIQALEIGMMLQYLQLYQAEGIVKSAWN
jgi:hypothetical protein